MSYFKIDSYKLNNLQKTFLPATSPYAKRHFEKAKQTGNLGHRVVHVLTGILHCIPILCMIATLVEKALMSHARSPSERQNPESSALNASTSLNIDPTIPAGAKCAKIESVETSSLVDSGSNFTSSDTLLTTESSPGPRGEEDNSNSVLEETRSEFPERIADIDPCCLEATRRLMNQPGFVDDGTLSDHKHYQHGPVSVVQGHEHLRHETWQLFQKHVDLMNPAALKQCKKHNPALYKVLQMKRFGHRFSLGKTFHVDGKSHLFEGFNEAFTLPMIASSLKQFSEENRNVLDQETADWLTNKLTQAITHESENVNYEQVVKNILDPNYKEPIVIAHGYDWHLKPIVFWNGFFIDINRGNGRTRGKSGIRVYKIGNLQSINATLIRNLSQRLGQTDSTYLSEDLLERLLNLQLITEQEMKAQEAKNCTFANTIGTVELLLAIHHLQSNSMSDNPIVVPGGMVDWPQAFDKAKPLYKKWQQFDRRLVMDNFLSDFEEAQKTQNSADNQLYKDAIKALQYSLLSVLPSRWERIRRHLTDSQINRYNKLTVTASFI